MNHKKSTALFILSAFLCGYVYAHWTARDPSVVSAKSARQILFYRCPMHPAYTSTKPGTSPCCHMTLEPVYADDPSTPPPADAPNALRLDPQQQQMAGIQYGTAEFTSDAQSIRGAARVGVNEKHVARVETRLEGWIDEVFIHAPGENVKQYQTLFTVYNRKAVATQLDFLHAMDVRMTAVMAGNSAPIGELAEADAILAGAKQRMDAAGFTDAQMDAIARSRHPFQKVPVVAPIAGTVIELQAVAGQMLTPAAVLTIADLSTVWVTAQFAGVDAAAVHPGQSATLRVPLLPGKTFHGLVDAILPRLDFTTGSLQVRLQFDNPGLFLRPEMFGEIELATEPGRRNLTVPAEALIDTGRAQSVFVDLGNSYVAPREVTAGRRLGDRVEILRGLDPGARIVTSGGFLLDSETRMRQAR